MLIPCYWEPIKSMEIRCLWGYGLKEYKRLVVTRICSQENAPFLEEVATSFWGLSMSEMVPYYAKFFKCLSVLYTVLSDNFVTDVRVIFLVGHKDDYICKATHLNSLAILVSFCKRLWILGLDYNHFLNL